MKNGNMVKPCDMKDGEIIDIVRGIRKKATMKLNIKLRHDMEENIARELGLIDYDAEHISQNELEDPLASMIKSMGFEIYEPLMQEVEMRELDLDGWRMRGGKYICAVDMSDSQLYSTINYIRNLITGKKSKTENYIKHLKHEITRLEYSVQTNRQLKIMIHKKTILALEAKKNADYANELDAPIYPSLLDEVENRGFERCV